MTAEYDGDIDLEKARLDPGSVFASPEVLANYPGLSPAQKIELLRRWAYDASELAVAEEEGMKNGEDTLLARVLSVLNELTGGYDVEHSPPTKQEGV
ncbi:MAG: hypothetical protein ACLFQT_09800 [Thiohalophilus sp.]